MSIDEQLQLVTEANVVAQMQNLHVHPAVYEYVRLGKLHVHGWMYDIASGEIRRFDMEKGQFVPLIAEPIHLPRTVPMTERKIA